MYQTAKLAFEKYMDDYDRNNILIKTKYTHTYQVVELMAELAYRLNLTSKEIELAKVIGLLHDIGRFEQIKQFNIISDVKTKFDHADFGCDYLFNNHHIRDFGINEDSKEATIIKDAIINHNKYKIENINNKKSLLFAKMIRDTDKIDIYRAVAIRDGWYFNANEITEEVLKEFSMKKTINTKKLKTKSDQVLFYLAFIFDINFNESLDILVHTDNFDLFLSVIEVSEDSEKLWKKVRELSFDKINRGVEND